jgi:hypothetical protein
MSSHWRCWGSAFLLFAGFSVTPAFSDPLTDLTDLFSPSTKEAAAPAPTQEECLLQPGKSTPGQHWVYRLEGHRKCWFQTDEANVSTKKQAHHHAEKQPVVPPAKNEAALREKKILDARAQLLSAAVDTSMPAATSAAPAMPDAGQGNWELTATRAGLVLVALGLVFLLGSLLASRFLGPRIAPIPRA